MSNFFNDLEAQLEAAARARVGGGVLLRIRGRIGRLGGGLSVAAALVVTVAVVAIALSVGRGHGRPGAASHRPTSRPPSQSPVPSPNGITGWTPVTARVIWRNPTLWYQRIEVDKGSNNGVRVDDPVVGDGALVGKVSSVGQTFSVIRLITDPSVNVAVQATDSSGDRGVVRPNVGNPDELLLEPVQQLRPGPRVGQPVLTASFKSGGLEPTYPRGLLIGTVTNVSAIPRSHGRVAHVAPAADLRHLVVVEVLTQKPSVSGLANSPSSARVLRGNGIGAAKFGEPPGLVTRRLTRLFGRPPTRRYYRNEDCCGIDHSTDWPGLTVIFGHRRFVGYSYGSFRPDRTELQLATKDGLTIGDTVARGERLYGPAFQVSAVNGGGWSLNTPHGRLIGYTSAITKPSGKILTIEAGDVGGPAVTP